MFEDFRSEKHNFKRQELPKLFSYIASQLEVVIDQINARKENDFPGDNYYLKQLQELRLILDSTMKNFDLMHDPNAFSNIIKQSRALGIDVPRDIY